MFSADSSLGSHRWPVVRLVAGHRTEVVLHSRAFFCLTTHWVKYTTPCPGEDCPLCELIPARGLFYLAATAGSRLSMLELGAQSSAHLEQHARLLHGGLCPGQVVQLFRKSAKAPVYSEIVREQAGASEVIPLDLAAHVMALYKFPPPNPGQSIEQYEANVRKVALVRVRRAADSLLRHQKELR